MRKISKAGLDLIKHFEGCRLYAYKPVPTEQFWTIGWGHYGPDVEPKSVITQAQADAMLVKDMAEYEFYVNNPAYVPITDSLNQNQFDALVSFCYNCGAGNLKSLCKGRTASQIAQSIMKYDKAGGKVLAGLTRRRNAEWGLFNKPVADTKEDETMDKAKVLVNGKPIADGLLIGGKTYVPLRALGEALGATVGWDGKTNTATVSK
ncbi:glycoside hydrolase family protein [Paenibacillus sp. S02]|uniref:glycoside hydrolase family protein n=1 Tax=Paenibacillus sp. S02 TaxID=2823904 RepID=UPI0021AD411A|nr:glycoside hydrolase family protein [Paenibacillus sp. S02]QYK68242.1 Phage lysozyme [Paenibacillus sp. S02]